MDGKVCQQSKAWMISRNHQPSASEKCPAAIVRALTEPREQFTLANAFPFPPSTD